MKTDPHIIAAVEAAFNRHPYEPIEILGAVQILAVMHGTDRVLAALAQLHLTAVSRLRFVK